MGCARMNTKSLCLRIPRTSRSEDPHKGARCFRQKHALCESEVVPRVAYYRASL